MATRQALATYLDEIAGETGELLAAESAARGLPVYLAHTYELHRGQLLGQELLFALQREGVQAQTPKRLEADHEALLRAVPGAFVVLVLHELPSYVRRRLVAATVPFVVPGRQVFLPTMLIDLRERQPRAARAATGHLAWATQVVLLRHLLHGDVERRNLAGVASVCGYSAMAISNAQRQLVDTELAGLRKAGRSKHLVFAGPGRQLWERALPLLRRPWRRRHPVTTADTRPRTWIAGVDALAHETLLAPGRIPTVAMAAEDLRAHIAAATLTPCPAADEADLLVEAWEYAPGCLAEGDRVDALSLCLCLRDDPDERVQIALEQHMASLTW